MKPLDADFTFSGGWARIAKLCRAAGGELEQIQLLLGHAPVLTTERYLGTRQNLVQAVNDNLPVQPE